MVSYHVIIGPNDKPIIITCDTFNNLIKITNSFKFNDYLALFNFKTYRILKINIIDYLLIDSNISNIMLNITYYHNKTYKQYVYDAVLK
jgi:hypothetical protein